MQQHRIDTKHQRTHKNTQKHKREHKRETHTKYKHTIKMNNQDIKTKTKQTTKKTKEQQAAIIPKHKKEAKKTITNCCHLISIMLF